MSCNFTKCFQFSSSSSLSSSQEINIAVDKYCENAEKLVIWLKKTITILDNRDFPNRVYLMQVCYSYFTHYGIMLLPVNDSLFIC